MNTFELLILITIILSVICIVTTSFLIYYKNKHDDACYSWNFEVDKKNEKIFELKSLIDYQQVTIKHLQEKLKESEKTFKIEKVVMSPKEITCKFEISNCLELVDAECLKRHAFDALNDYIIREYDNNPSLFNIQRKRDPITLSTHFRLNVRLLPYPNPSDTFETMCKEMEEHS